MSRFKKAVFLSFVLMLLFGGFGCKQEGPMERAGEKMDKAVEDAGEAVKEMGKSKDDQ